MPTWLYDLPNWLFGALIVLTWAAFGVAGHELVHRMLRLHIDEHDRNLALALLAVIATINSLLLAFSAISVWDAFGTADKAVSGEATTVSELSRDLAVFNTPTSLRARVQLRAYTQSIVADEWPTMRTEQASDTTRLQFDRIFRAVGAIEPVTPREMALMPEIWARANELIKFRRHRLDASQGRVPGTLWVVVIAGTIMSLLPTFVLPRSAFNRVAIGGLSLSMGLVFFFVAAMDRPFAGKESIGPQPFEASLASMSRWDAQGVKQGSGSGLASAIDADRADRSVHR